MSLDWTIGLNGDKYLRGRSNNSLIRDFESIPKDTIEYMVQNGSDLSDNPEKMIIGKFILYKKQSSK